MDLANAMLAAWRATGAEAPNAGAALYATGAFGAFGAAKKV